MWSSYIIMDEIKFGKYLPLYKNQGAIEFWVLNLPRLFLQTAFVPQQNEKLYKHSNSNGGTSRTVGNPPVVVVVVKVLNKN